MVESESRNALGLLAARDERLRAVRVEKDDAASRYEDNCLLIDERYITFDFGINTKDIPQREVAMSVVDVQIAHFFCFCCCSTVITGT
jgi:hypothetical protein